MDIAEPRTARARRHGGFGRGDRLDPEPRHRHVESQPDERERHQHDHAEPRQPAHGRFRVRHDPARGRTALPGGIRGQVMEQGRGGVWLH